MSASLPQQSQGERSESPPCASWTQEGGEIVLELSGDWQRDGRVAEIKGEAPDQTPVRFATDKLGSFDSTLPAFLFAQLRSVEKSSEDKGDAAKPSLEGLPANLAGLMQLALGTPEEIEARTQEEKLGMLGKLGQTSIKAWNSFLMIGEFTGLSLFSLGRFVTHRARFRSRDFWLVMQECGAEALPIVALISFLIGMILAFVGNVQLTNFGANIYVADLVGIAMVREMGVVMTAIIMSGRTGAAFAAHLGSMKANEEIDALRTFGFDPFDFLVLPRMIALIVMMPLLTLYSNVIGILGGMLVGAWVDITPALYWHEILTSITLTTASLGIFKSFFFGVIIAMSGCLQGMNAGNSSAAVGEATTRAVVTSITAIIILDSAFAAIFTVLEI